MSLCWYLSSLFGMIFGISNYKCDFICSFKYLIALEKQTLILLMISWNVFSQSISWPECFVTLVAWNWHSLQMIDLNVVLYCSGSPFFTTYLANFCLLLTISIPNHILTCVHHWLHSGVQILHIHRQKSSFGQNQCSVFILIGFFC